MKITNTLVVFDLETTGTWIEKDRIIEIAMVKLSPSGEKQVFHSRVNPLMPIPLVVQQLTGITEKDVEDAVQHVYENLFFNGGVIAQCEFGPGAKPENIRALYVAWDSKNR